MNQITDTSAFSLLACDEGFDPVEDRLRANIRGTIEAVFNEELDGFLGRLRYGREAGAAKGYRHGSRDRQITGTFGSETISVPRARIADEAGDDVIAYLGRHGIEAQWLHRDAGRRRITHTLLDVCAEVGADMLSMGAYEHSKFTEDLLGGVTRDILTDARLPVMMSH